MQTLAIWVQAISTFILAVLTIWVIFFSEVGDLAIQLLQFELWETKQQMNVLHEEKEEIKNQRNRLQEERNSLERQKEEHLVHVANGRLRDLWNLGAKKLAAYRKIAEISQELLNLTKKVDQYRNWDEGKITPKIGVIWGFILPNPEEVHDFRRWEWGDVLLDVDSFWQCSKDLREMLNVYDVVEFDPQGSRPNTNRRAKLMNEWYQKIAIEEKRRLAEYHVSCFDEFESKVRQLIELENGKTALSIRDFSESLLDSYGFSKSDKEVIERIRDRLTKELNSNRQLAELKIQVLVTKGTSLQEIAEEAKRIIINVNFARGWLDDATQDRHKWTN